MNLFASFLFASIGISSCSALDFAVIDAVDIDTSGNLPPLAERDEEAPRIVGGTPAANGAYPWFGQSVITFSQSGNTITAASCGASLIHPRFAVSAMHCVENTLAPNFWDYSITLYFGANKYDGTDAVAERKLKGCGTPQSTNFP
jgi:secreted trypsin-like serine protease